MRELDYEVAQDMAIHGIGVFGTGDESLRTIFVGELPIGLEKGIMVRTVQSPSPERYIDTERQVIEFISKGTHSDEARQLLRDVYDLYNRRYHWDTTNWHIYFSEVIGGIVDMSRNIEGSKMFRLSIQFISRNLNTIS